MCRARSSGTCQLHKPLGTMKVTKTSVSKRPARRGGRSGGLRVAPDEIAGSGLRNKGWRYREEAQPSHATRFGRAGFTPRRCALPHQPHEQNRLLEPSGQSRPQESRGGTAAAQRIRPFSSAHFRTAPARMMQSGANTAGPVLPHRPSKPPPSLRNRREGTVTYPTLPLCSEIVQRPPPPPPDRPERSHPLPTSPPGWPTSRAG